jgi:FlgD Ig-like domain
MKLNQRFLATLAVLAMSAIGFVRQGYAQNQGVSFLWAHYNVVYVNEFYNPLAGGTVIPNSNVPPVNFVNFTGAIDMDDGTANNIPVGFNFDYNGNTYSSVNVNINGYVTVGKQPIAPTPYNNSNLFTSVLPNNTLAPYWGDHFYRTSEPGYTPSRISYLTTFITDPNPNAKPFSKIYTFTVEWKNLNINDKTNPNSVASFQLQIVQNPLANDQSVPDDRATFVYQYGPIGTGGTVTTNGDAVGADDSVGFTFINALYQTASFSGDSTAENTATRTSTWPPSGLPSRVIELQPAGQSVSSIWGDGDVFLLQKFSPDPNVRNNQNRFVTLADAIAILEAASNETPLDSIEGAAAFHGNATHYGRMYQPLFGGYYYYTTPYDAAYILMYLAGKLSTLPWPIPLPVPGYKADDIHTTDVSGIVADVSNIKTTGSTVLVPITVRGTVNGALSIDMKLNGLDASGVQFVGTRGVNDALITSNPTLGHISLATSGDFADGATVGYLEFTKPANTNAAFDITNVKVNNVDVPSSHVALMLANSGIGTSESSLSQNFPNPFMASTSAYTTIGFTLDQPENVTMRVYDMLGHEVRTLVSDEGRLAGANSVEWDGRDVSGNLVPSGLYYYQLVTADFTQTVKMQVIR